MAVEARDSTLPPLAQLGARICPRCRRPAPEGSGPDERCPDHRLAFVESRALLESGHDPLLGVTLAGRFTVLARIGSGSMGSVYRARQDAVGRDVALKIVRPDRAHDPETKARFEREARAVSTLKSQHTVTAFDFGEAEDGSWFLALEMLEGETLGDRLRRELRLDWVEALRFASEALTSLAEAHAQGIIHRDLKPDNLFLARAHGAAGDHELCKILDFGIAKWLRDDEAPLDQLQTLAGTVFGTPRYMSPEQAQGVRLDARSDLYSLGVLLYQMLAGRAPFVDDDAVVVMAEHIKNAPPFFADAAPGVSIPGPIEAAVRRALEKLPENRPANAEQMLSELSDAAAAARAAESGVRATQAPADDVPASLRLAKRRTLVLGALLAASVSAVLGLAVVVWKQPVRSWIGPSGGAALRQNLDPFAAFSATAAGRDHARQAALQPAKAATVASNSAASSLENSAATAPRQAVPMASASSSGQALRAVFAAPSAALGPKKLPRAHKSTTPLERKGNERYGRFE